MKMKQTNKEGVFKLPDYSVLMSVYYKETPAYFETAITSILNQTVKTNDFVLVCDGTLTKELNDIIKKYDTFLHVQRLPKNEGLCKALSCGIKLCKNEFIARMDSDDISCPGRCEKELYEFVKNPHLSIVSAAISEFTESPEVMTGKRVLPCRQDEIIKYSRRRCPFNHPVVMYRKSALMAAEGYLDDFRMEDYYLWIRMLKKGCKSENLPDVLLYMRAPADMYLRRGGKQYADDMLKFHKWMLKTGWSAKADFFFGAIPHYVVCILPNGLRRIIYTVIHT